MIGLKYIFLFNIAVLTAHSTNVGIIGGQKANIEDHPWMVSVFIGFDDGFVSFICSGFLISPNWAVTAAQCVIEDLLSAIGVGSNSSSPERTHLVKIANTIIHPDYKLTFDENPINDIALLNLSEPIKDPIAKPITLPEPLAEVKPGTSINITGWGQLDDKEHSDELHTITLQVISLDDCIDAFKGHSLFINETFCIGKFNENKGICNGDTGGPSDVNGVAAGIASWSRRGCADNGFPSVFTNISYYREWIREVTNI